MEAYDYDSEFSTANLEKILGGIEWKLESSIEDNAPMLPLSLCIDLAELERELTPAEYGVAKRYWVYHRKMTEFSIRMAFFKEHPIEHYKFLMGCTSIKDELESHWLEIDETLKH